MLSVTISKGNRKMGAIPSVSLPPCTTCNPDAPCFQKCYAVRLARRYTNVARSYKNNLEILTENPAEYWHQVRKSAQLSKYFRFHVSGDIPHGEYLADMANTASDLPGTKFLVFTKQYHIVNKYLADGGKIPRNLKIIFSNWGAWKCPNPHNLPVCEVILKGTTPPDNWKICGGNCTDCACRGVGCWELKNGETLGIYEH